MIQQRIRDILTEGNTHRARLSKADCAAAAAAARRAQEATIVAEAAAVVAVLLLPVLLLLLLLFWAGVPMAAAGAHWLPSAAHVTGAAEASVGGRPGLATL